MATGKSDDLTAAFKITVHIETLLGLMYAPGRNQTMAGKNRPAWRRLPLEMAAHPEGPRIAQ